MNIDRKDRSASMKHHLYLSTCCIALILVHSAMSLFLFLSLFLSLPLSFLLVCNTVICYVIPSRPAVQQLCRCATHARAHMIAVSIAWHYGQELKKLTPNVDRINIHERLDSHRNGEDFRENVKIDITW